MHLRLYLNYLLTPEQDVKTLFQTDDLVNFISLAKPGSSTNYSIKDSISILSRLLVETFRLASHIYLNKDFSVESVLN